MSSKLGLRSPDWASDIFRITNKLMTDSTSDEEFKQKNEAMDSLKSPSDWMNFVLYNFDWEPFDILKGKTPGAPFPLPPLNNDDCHAHLPDPDEFISNIRGQYHPTRGRFIAATKDLTPGELILREKPFASIVDFDRVKEVCDTCKLRPADGLDYLICESCRSIAWCSQDCKQASLRAYHVWECHYMRKMHSSFLHHSMSFRMILRNWKSLLHRFCLGAEYCKEKRVNSQDIDEFDLITNFENLNKLRCLEYSLFAKTILYILKAGGFFIRLREAAAEIKQNLLKQLMTQTQLEEVTGTLKLIVNYQILFTDMKLERKLETFVGTVLLEHMLRIKNNCFELNMQLVWKRFTDPPSFERAGVSRIGTVLFLKASQINHSCRPNCDYYFTGETQNVKTIDFIKKGEEIFITYERVAKAMPDREDRLPHLLNNFGFNCFCRFCIGPKETDLVGESTDKTDVKQEVIHQIDLLMEQSEEAIRLMNLDLAENLLFRCKDLAKVHHQFQRLNEIDELISQTFALRGNVFFSNTY